MSMKPHEFKEKLKGVVHLTLTPFDENGDLDEKALRRGDRLRVKELLPMAIPLQPPSRRQTGRKRFGDGDQFSHLHPPDADVAQNRWQAHMTATKGAIGQP